MIIAKVFVPGRARTKGHMTPQGNRGGAKDRPLLLAWMRTLNREIQKQCGVKLARVAGKVVRVDGKLPYADAVEVHCFFRFSRQLSAVNGEVVESHGTLWPTVIHIGDEDTLRRAALDALTKAGILADDRWSVGGMNYKRWCTEGEQPGVLIVVEEASAPEEVRCLERELELRV
jgi:hypothetical protein